MSETRKSDFIGDVFGDWTVIARAEGGGDRKRRWVVSNGQTEMTVLQTGLSDLALTKAIQDRNAATDADRAARGVVAANHAETQGAFGNVFSLTEAEADLYRRLDNNIIDARRSSLGSSALLREAVASVALDNDPECGTYSLAELNPFAISEDPLLYGEGPDDSDCPECGDDDDDDFVNLLLDAMVQEVSDRSVGGNLPSPVASFPADMLGEIARAEADLTAALQDATGDATLSVVYATTPLQPVATLPAEWAFQVVQEEKIQALIDEVIKIKVALNNVINLIEGLRG